MKRVESGMVCAKFFSQPRRCVTMISTLGRAAFVKWFASHLQVVLIVHWTIRTCSTVRHGLAETRDSVVRTLPNRRSTA